MQQIIPLPAQVLLMLLLGLVAVRNILSPLQLKHCGLQLLLHGLHQPIYARQQLNVGVGAAQVVVLVPTVVPLLLLEVVVAQVVVMRLNQSQI
jgi:hypothetical protein